MTVIIPEFSISELSRLELVSLKVADFEKISCFYQDVIGLTLLQKSTNQHILGTMAKSAFDDKIKAKELLILTRVDNPLPKERKTGLYHVAFLLPTRAALGNALNHYIKIEAPLEGVSDHGYSEAVYLRDSEGNGIEVYCDKDRSYWDIRDDGEIVGVTLEMDVASVLEADDSQWQGLPIAARIGHVHLQVADLNKTEEFYTDILGLSLKSNYGSQAKFFAAGSYHHHIGANTWLGKNLPPMADNDLGLAYYQFSLKDKAEIAKLSNRWIQKNIEFKKLEDESLEITDPNGIKVRFKALGNS